MKKSLSYNSPPNEHTALNKMGLAKKLGMRKGWPDLEIYFGGQTIFIEFKCGDGQTLGAATGTSLVVGHTAQLTLGAGVSGQFQDYGTTAATATSVLGMFNTTDATQAEMQFYKSGNASIGSATVVASGEQLGSVSWYGAQQTSTLATVTKAAGVAEVAIQERTFKSLRFDFGGGVSDKKKLTFLAYAKKADRIFRAANLKSLIPNQLKRHKRQLKDLCYEEILSQWSKRHAKAS